MGLMDFFYNGVDLSEDGEPVKKQSRNTELARDRETAATKFELNDLERGFSLKNSNNDYPRVAKASSDKKVANISEVLVYSPNSYEDIEKLIDHLKVGSAIIVDLHHIKESSAQRILDFLSGAIYAIDGSVAKLQPSMFLLTPGSVDINYPRNE